MRYVLFLLILLLSVTPLWASSVDVNLLGNLVLDSTPRQVVATADGKRIYLLTESGEVIFFSSNGAQEGRFEVGPDVTGIAPQGANRLILQLAQKKQLSIIAIEPIVQIDTTNSPILGDQNAPIMIAIYDDFECPYCAKSEPMIKQVLQQYAGKVKLAFKNFPLNFHKNAKPAALAALAAGRQGKFWELHDLLFENYSSLSPARIRQLAEQLQLDMVQFERDKSDPELLQQIDFDLQEGQRIGVRGTPTIFINGRRLQQRSLAGFAQMIEAELARQAQEKE